MGKHTTARTVTPGANPGATSTIAREPGGPLRFVGRARFALDRDALAAKIGGELHRIATPTAIDESRVREYCADRGIHHHRFEAALLAEAFKVVSAPRLIERLVGDLRQRMPRVLERPMVCTADLQGSALVLRIGADLFIEPRYTVSAANPDWSVLNGFATAAGSLSLVGALRAGSGDGMRIDAGWRVRPGVSCAELGRRAGEPFAETVGTLVGCLAGDALARFTAALPGEIAGVLNDAGEPTFVNVERLLRLGRLTHSTRVYLLYWKRLRDYLIWSVGA